MILYSCKCLLKKEEKQNHVGYFEQAIGLRQFLIYTQFIKGKTKQPGTVIRDTFVSIWVL